MTQRTSLALAVVIAAAAPAACRAQSITFDASSTGQVRAANTVSWSHTVGAGTNRLLVVGTGTEDNPITMSNSVVTGVTYGGAALTRVTGAQRISMDTTAGTENYTDLWFMLNPPTGTANVIVNTAGTLDDLMGGAVSFANVRQQPREAVGGMSVTTTTFSTLSATITTQTPNALVVDIGLHSTSNGTMTPGAGQTEAWDQSTAGARTAFSYRFVPTPGQVTDSWTADGATPPLGRMAISLAAFAPVPEPATSLAVAGAGGLLLAVWRRRRASR
jgi:PEP-CTERM motif